MLSFQQDKRRKKLLEQANPELSVGEPGTKRRSRSGLGAQKLSVPDAEQTMEGVRRIQNASKENSESGNSDDTLKFVGGWGEIIASAFSYENEATELEDKRKSLNLKSSYKGEKSKESSNLIDFVIKHEDFSSTAYDDFKQTSIGYGTKATSKNQTISKAEARKLLEKDLDSARKAVLKLKETAGYDWNENQIDALTSFTYNLGPGNLKKLTEDGTRGDEEISDMILEYKYAGGKVQGGLIERRKAELKLFNEGY